MTARNLSIVFGPNFTAPPADPLAAHLSTSLNQVVAVLISQSKLVFDNDASATAAEASTSSPRVVEAYETVDIDPDSSSARNSRVIDLSSDTKDGKMEYASSPLWGTTD